MPRPCRNCAGAGSVWRNPREGLTLVDPQQDVNEPCPRCGGSGDEPSDERLDNLYAIAQEHENERWAA